MICKRITRISRQQKLKQVLQNLKTGETVLEEVPCPHVSNEHVLIRTAASLVSAGTERMLIDFGKGNLIQKAQQQPDKVKQVLEKVKTEEYCQHWIPLRINSIPRFHWGIAMLAL